jgi:hypothetical protein
MCNSRLTNMDSSVIDAELKCNCILCNTVPSAIDRLPCRLLDSYGQLQVNQVQPKIATHDLLRIDIS